MGYQRYGSVTQTNPGPHFRYHDSTYGGGLSCTDTLITIFQVLLIGYLILKVLEVLFGIPIPHF